MASLLRRHPNPLPAAGVPAHLIRRFSTLPDVDHPPLPTSTPTPPPPPHRPRRGQPSPHPLHRCHRALPPQRLPAPPRLPPALLPRCVPSPAPPPTRPRRLAPLRPPRLRAASPGLLARAISLFSSPDDTLRAFSDSAPAARSNVSSPRSSVLAASTTSSPPSPPRSPPSASSPAAPPTTCSGE
uniref:Uncharacterized protein n=1 Tax=Oryza barthii TaxID=65489 RepID=A0A0D3HHK2_9ORYZ